MPTLTEIRISKDLTQSMVAEMAGISAATVNRLENGRPVQKSTFISICRALDVSPQDVTGVNLHSGVRAAAKRKKKNV